MNISSLKCQPSRPPNPQGARAKRRLNSERYNVVRLRHLPKRELQVGFDWFPT